ncbi:HNH endonuclease [Frankia sp. CNm7]|uniref:HNH endonuclease n=1 Tax=Frankia nepalensis TaxID=1836974 RepID=A0A937UW04_9ACTN|nr:HNH endonuclease family protein [Frankia nepalensis]MBL7494872.1 HNH endonuclease [Frankia nepalensis]MBL7514422.1 HNH endonuclease [Frankia nepalensis]MBL7519867.1 HNH endonuclease [Frankia nepalensis]MBL7632866.1 HNH endonuclease [Frankia nepalensis]
MAGRGGRNRRGRSWWGRVGFLVLLVVVIVVVVVVVRGGGEFGGVRLPNPLDSPTAPPPASTPPAGGDPSGPATPPGPAAGSLRAAVDGLPVAAEDRTGYARERFQHWIDADRDGCDTRREVLIGEAITPPTVGPRCALSGGQWRSYYDDKVWTDPNDLDIDHMVPLAEAWDSGASAWSDEQRRAYANDLDDPRALVAVTDNENQTKADQDPAEWMPPLASATCLYIGEWVAVKLRWQLTVDTAEKTALSRIAATCPDEPITVTLAAQGVPPP